MGNRADALEINHPFLGHALNAVDAKGRVSVPASFRSLIDKRVKLYGVEGDAANDKELMIAPAPSGECLRAYDVLGQRQLVADLHASVADMPPLARREALSALRRSELGNLLPVSFDGAGRMVLPQLLREIAEIGDVAYFVGVEDYFEIWSLPRLVAASADDPIKRRMLDQYMRERGIA